MSQPAIFLDKDGTLVENVPFNVDPELLELTPGAAAGLCRWHAAGYRIVIVTNQSGVARGYFPRSALAAVEHRLRLILDEMGVPLAGFYHCPHHPNGNLAEFSVDCHCRKPRPGMLLDAAEDLDIDLAASWMIGDTLDDIEAGNRAGCRAILVENGGETQWRLNSLRVPDAIVANIARAADHVADASVGTIHGAALPALQGAMP